MRIARRTLLIGGSAAAGLVVAVALWPESANEPGPNGDYAFNSYIRIAPTGAVTVAVPQVETGQGIWTALPMIVAEELGAAWRDIAVEPAPLEGGFDNSLAGNEGWLDHLGAFRRWSVGGEAARITAGATSIRAFGAPMTAAARAARGMLVAAAARRTDFNATDFDCADSFVLAPGRALSFAELAGEASTLSPANVGPRKARARAQAVARTRLDGPAKTDGSFRLGPDVRLPDLLHASVRLAPTGGRIAGFDRTRIGGMLGIRHVGTGEGWVAVVADDWSKAERAISALEVRLDGPAFTGDARPWFDAALDAGDWHDLMEVGEDPGPIAGAAALAATYYVAPSQHLALEPESATARIVHDRLECWAGSQAPGFASDLGARALYPMPVGEPAGRALENRALPIAIDLAQKLRRPVQVTLPHKVSQNLAPLSTGALARCKARIGRGGLPTSISIDWVSADGMAATMQRLSGAEPQTRLAERFDGRAVPYSLPHVRIRGATPDLPYAIGYMRGSPQREMAFVVESFIGELARYLGKEPLSYRMALLGGNPRLAHCFQRVATLSEWDGGQDGSTMGLAGASAFGSHIAVIASASIDPVRGLKVHRLVAAVDAGQVVDRRLATSQVEAALIWGLAQARIAEPEFSGGVARSRSLGSAGLQGIADTPEIIVEFMPGSDPPGGLSGLGAVPVAAAIADAVQSGSGRRMRNLPFVPMG